MRHRKSSGNPERSAGLAGSGGDRQRPALWSTLRKPQLNVPVETTGESGKLSACPQPVDR
jgi:hypothetical protein